MNYAELQAEVADFAHRTDLSGKMDIFCEFAEAVINKDLRTIEMERRTPETFADTFYNLPQDYMEMRALHLDINGARSTLRCISPQLLDKSYSRATGVPRAYAIHGGQIEFRPGIDVTAPYTGELSYYARVPSLILNSNNNILTKYPNIYLSAMLVQLYLYLQDKEEAATWSEMYNTQVKQANKQGGRWVTPSVAVV